MKVRTASRIALFALALGCAAAITDEQRPLQPVNREAFPDEKRCSEYFYSNTFDGAVSMQIIFAYQAADGSTKRDMVAAKRATVQISDGLTYEKTMIDGDAGAVFRLTSGEYAKAHECLPEPKTKAPGDSPMAKRM